MTIAHVTVVPPRGRPGRIGCWTTRRLSTGARTNLCGAAPTLRDLPVRDVRRMTDAQCAEWKVCAECLKHITRFPRAKGARRNERADHGR